MSESTPIPSSDAYSTIEKNYCTPSWSERAKNATLSVASILNDPVCKVREYYYTFSIVGHLHDSPIRQISHLIRLCLGIGACSLIAPISTPAGIALRYVVSRCASKKFIFLKKATSGKTLPANRIIKLVSHNQCYVPAGYSISDGGVTPSSDRSRMDRNTALVKRYDPDIITLFEVTDIRDANYLTKQYSDYPFVIPVSGIRSLGPTSMIYIASKYEIDKKSIEFIPFIKDIELTGPAKHSSKGFVSFDLIDNGTKKPFATVIATHLQHSEIPNQPEPHEITSRQYQLDKIINHIEDKAKKDRNIIFTGDLNLTEEELQSYFKEKGTRNLKRDPEVKDIPTWGGDEWCAKLSKKTPSPKLVLDYTFIAGVAKKIMTQTIFPNYSAQIFSKWAGSDHHLLHSQVELG